MKFVYMLLVFSALFFSGCTEPRIDAATDESMRKSIEEVRDSLEAEEQKEFDEAMKIILFSNINMSGVLVAAFSGSVPDKENMIKDLKKSLDKKTAQEVINEAKKIKEEIEKK